MKTTISAKQAFICLLRAKMLCRDKVESGRIDKEYFGIELEKDFRRQLVFYGGVSKAAFKDDMDYADVFPEEQ